MASVDEGIDSNSLTNIWLGEALQIDIPESIEIEATPMVLLLLLLEHRAAVNGCIERG